MTHAKVYHVDLENKIKSCNMAINVKNIRYIETKPTKFKGAGQDIPIGYLITIEQFIEDKEDLFKDYGSLYIDEITYRKLFE